MPTNHTGFDVFMRVPESDSPLVGEGGAGNTGSARVDGTRVLDATEEFAGPYTITVQDSGNGELEFLVTGPDDPVGQTNAVTADATIEMDGRQLSLKGTPEVGDTFTLRESEARSVFDNLGALADALEASGSDSGSRANFANVANNVLTGLDAGLENFGRVRSEVGARLNAIDNEREANEARVVDLKAAKSKIEDLDYAEAITDLQLRQVGLQAAQQSYLQIQGLSLFNFL